MVAVTFRCERRNRITLEPTAPSETDRDNEPERNVMSDTSTEFKADLNDNSPLYMQVARKLILDVREGRYQVDQALPSERLLSEQLDVSRVTARKAIDQLVEQGLV